MVDDKELVEVDRLMDEVLEYCKSKGIAVNLFGKFNKGHNQAGYDWVLK